MICVVVFTDQLAVSKVSSEREQFKMVKRDMEVGSPIELAVCGGIRSLFWINRKQSSVCVSSTPHFILIHPDQAKWALMHKRHIEQQHEVKRGSITNDPWTRFPITTITTNVTAIFCNAHPLCEHCDPATIYWPSHLYSHKRGKCTLPYVPGPRRTC